MIKKYANDYENDDVIPIVSYPYKKSRTTVSQHTNVTNKTNISDVTECLTKCDPRDFTTRVMECFRNHMTNVTVINFDPRNQDDFEYCHDLNNFELLDEERISFLGRREVFSFINDMDKWIDIYDQGKADLIKIGLPVMGEQIVDSLHRASTEFDTFHKIQSLEVHGSERSNETTVNSSARTPFTVELNNYSAVDDEEESITPLKPDIQYNVSAEYPLKAELGLLCDRYPDVLNAGVGRYNGKEYQFNIETEENALPIRHYPFKMPEDKRRVLRNQIADHILSGRIRPSKSAWAARAFLVSKKDAKSIDDWRMVIDYGELNKITKLFPFPSPDSDYIMSSMAGAKYFSGMDIHSAFHQIPCSDEATIEKTAFVTPDGLYEWLSMPMGVSNGPAYQQALMHKIFGDLIGQGVHVFIDDIIVYAKTAAEHNRILKMVFERLRTHGLTLKGSKCHFGQNEINYLGFIIGSDGIKPDPSKCDAINSLAAPYDVKSLQSVLGTFQFYARFVKDFARITKPLTKLLKKYVDWKWGNEEQEAFDEIKKVFRC